MPLRLFLFLLISFSTPAFAQHHLKGQVLDASTHQPLAFATISWEGSGAVADVNGFFETNIPEGVNAIQVSYLGYDSKRVALSGQENITIQLLPAKDSMNEVVVTSNNQK